MENPTKGKILDAATTLFLEHGYAGTSIGKIAKQAEVTHSLIFHHFTNKENLWVAVKKRIADNIANDKQLIPKLDLPYEAFLKKLFQNCMTYYTSNPDLIRLFNWQRLESTSNHKIGIVNSEDIHPWISAIKHYQQTGDINAKIRPEFVFSFIMSLISSTALDPNVFTQEETDRQKYIDFCVASLQKAFF